MKKTISLLCFCVLAMTTLSQTIGQFQKITTTDRDADDQFGTATSKNSLSELAVGASFESEDESGANPVLNAGAVYFYTPSGITWVETQKVVASDRNIDDNFGFSVSLDDNVLAVGAPNNDLDASGANPLSNTGAVYIYNKVAGVWVFQQKIVASDRAANDQFGFSVSIVGNRVFVGAPNQNRDAIGSNPFSDAGAVYEFELVAGTWIQSQKIVANDRDDNYLFGNSLSYDGAKLAVGSKGNNTDVGLLNQLPAAGAAYIFELAGTWGQTEKLVPGSRGAGDQFGSSLKLENNSLVVCSPLENEDENNLNPLPNSGSVFLFNFNAGSFGQTQKITGVDRSAGDNFGSSVDFSATHLAIGSIFQDYDFQFVNPVSNTGAVYVYEMNAGVYDFIGKVSPDVRTTNDELGFAVAVIDDVIFGTSLKEDQDDNEINSLNNAGALYAFRYCTTTNSFNVNVCDSYTVPSGDETYTISGQYLDTILNAAGCDSILTIDLVVTYSTTNTLDIDVCDQYVVPSGDETYIVSGTYMDTIPNAIGCDSILTINLSVLNTTASVDTALYESYTAPSGQEYFMSGTYTDIIANSAGCDSIITITLIIFDTPEAKPANLITPNDDGKNDNWFIEHAFTLDECDVKVFNRWGNVVFQSTGYDSPWEADDLNGNPVNDGAYFYTIICGDEVRYEGNITILK